MPEQFHINTDQLRVGLYVHLDLKWFEHPFAFNNFKLKSEQQIAEIRALGLKSVRYDPERSDHKPLPPVMPQQQQEADAALAPSDGTEPPAVSVIEAGLAAKRALIERIRAQREAAARVEGMFVDTTATIRDINKNLFTRPIQTVAQAGRLIDQIAESVLSAPELAVMLMGERPGGEDIYFHSLNVTMLALMIARDIRLPAELTGALGMGALFHDIGHTDIPSKILLKTEPLTKAEQGLYEMHCQYGVAIADRLRLSPGAIGIIRDHHELYDGSGYPRGLKGEEIGLLARIVALANYYDELCNPRNLADALTPHEALSAMFAKWRGRFDPKLLQVLVRCLGVYPPGTVVQLSNGVIGIVATINAARPQRPTVVIFDEQIPKDDAILIDMEHETDINVAKAIRPSQLPREVYDYLSPRQRVSYYFDARHADSKQAMR